MTTQPFEADTGRVLNIVINSLYSEKEIFLRELISNSSDAVDKRRFQKLSGQSTEKDSVNYEIEIGISPKDQILTISDNGIGMDKDDLISSLGTIAFLLIYPYASSRIPAILRNYHKRIGLPQQLEQR